MRPTTAVLFLDTNVPMYAAGGRHTLKEPAERVMRLAAAQARRFVTNAEVLQEILYRYLAQRRAAVGIALVHDFASVMRGRVEPVFGEDVEIAADLASSLPALDSRDLLHIATMLRLGVRFLVSADAKFDHAPQVERLDPMDVEGWALELGLLP